MNENPKSLEECCNEIRAIALELETRCRTLVANKAVTGEACAQSMLAVRHFEDARMRVGKIIQHTVGNGVSCFDSGRKTADDGR